MYFIYRPCRIFVKNSPRWYLAHTYRGQRRGMAFNEYNEKIDFAPNAANIGVNFSLDAQPFELSFFDSGDMKDTAIKIGNSNGDGVTLFY